MSTTKECACVYITSLFVTICGSACIVHAKGCGNMYMLVTTVCSAEDAVHEASTSACLQAIYRLNCCMQFIPVTFIRSKAVDIIHARKGKLQLVAALPSLRDIACSKRCKMLMENRVYVTVQTSYQCNRVPMTLFLVARSVPISYQCNRVPMTLFLVARSMRNLERRESVSASYRNACTSCSR